MLADKILSSPWHFLCTGAVRELRESGTAGVWHQERDPQNRTLETPRPLGASVALSVRWVWSADLGWM